MGGSSLIMKTYKENDIMDALQDMLDTPKGRSLMKILWINSIVVGILAAILSIIKYVNS